MPSSESDEEDDDDEGGLLVLSGFLAGRLNFSRALGCVSLYKSGHGLGELIDGANPRRTQSRLVGRHGLSGRHSCGQLAFSINPALPLIMANGGGFST